MFAVKVIKRKLLKVGITYRQYMRKQYYRKHYSVKWVCMVVKYTTDPTKPVQKGKIT